ncbi:hypothetical protein BGZ82_009801 [Podila clonocystis]|nr:hypothetical protein BGZ82_009801 [Podila clonocystis]
MNRAVIDFILAEKTRTQWQDHADLAPVIENMLQHNFQTNKALEQKHSLPQLLKLLQLTYDADEEQSLKLFSTLQSYCTIADPFVLAQLLTQAIVSNGELYPTMTTEAGVGWLDWALDYKQDLMKKGEVVKQLWRIAKARGEDIESQAIQLIVVSLVQKQEQEKNSDEESTTSHSQLNSRKHNVYYMLHCGPLADHELPLWDSESVINALVRLRDGLNYESYENQLLILVNLMERFFSWMDSTNSGESIEDLKLRVASYAKIPELLVFALDTTIKYLDGRWLKSEVREEVKNLANHNNLNVSLLDMNRERDAIQYVSTSLTGAQRYTDSKHTTRGKSLREREVPVKVGRTPAEREFEISDLVARCLQGHDTEVIEQVMRRFILHIGMRVDTAMVSASTLATKHAAQQRDKILLTMMSENPVYRRIMISVLDVDRRSASLCLSLIQGMLRCSVVHWSTCKNVAPSAYPKELKDAIWIAQLAEQTGLIPNPVNQATTLFPLIESRDVGLILEQCYYVLLVRNADTLQAGAPATVGSTISPVATMTDGPELSLLRRVIVKHASRAFHLMSLFAVSSKHVPVPVPVPGFVDTESGSEPMTTATAIDLAS